VLARFPLNPILPAQEGARAEAFYRDVLGLEQLSPPGADPMAFRAGGAILVLTELRDRVPPDYPVVDFGAVRSTWLRDSEGNLLALNELTA
jgi:catechol 2,3-dioxygenase-like lactoylglutathione lyase family enzyme